MTPLYPLRFQPLFRRYLWGGRRLATHLNKPIGDQPCAESWELVDRGADQSVVAAGPLAGTTLHELVATRADELFGRHAPAERFPLLFKFLDAQQTLSVQVHPDDARAARLPQPDLGKTEAWVVLAAEPRSVIYAGLKRGFDRHALEREVTRGTTELCLHRFQPRPGDCIFLPAGTLHALGAGLLVAELQQASDTTFRLFDWNRVGPDGKPRELHVEQAQGAIDYSLGPIDPVQSQQTGPGVERLVACDKFVLQRRTITAADTVGGDDRFHFLAVLEGELEIAGDPAGTLPTGGTALLPASLGQVSLRPITSATVLDCYLP